MYRIKESYKPWYKLGQISDGTWLQKALCRIDSTGHRGIDIFEMNGIKIVSGNEKAEFGFSLHGDPVQGVPKNRCILAKIEPPIYYWLYGRKLNNLKFIYQYMGVLSFQITEGLNQVHFKSPQEFNMVNQFFDQPKTELLCMILRNKTRNVRINNLFPSLRKYKKHSNMNLRIDADKEFCKILGSKYHSYGSGWCEPCFRGAVEEKSEKIIMNKYIPTVHPEYETISKYKFNFCPENSCFDGYVTEKPIQAMLCGSIPIYYGAPDVYKYLPCKTYIDYRNYTPKELCDYILNMSEEEYQKYRERIKKFITTEESKEFSSVALATKIIDIIGGRK